VKHFSKRHTQEQRSSGTGITSVTDKLRPNSSSSSVVDFLGQNNQWLVIINGVGNTQYSGWIEIKATVRGWTKKKKTITSKNNPKRV
jgi:hypothetical protein